MTTNPDIELPELPKASEPMNLAPLPWEAPATDKLAAALATAQGQMKPAVFNRVNPYFKSRYADLAAIFDAVRKPLADNGLAITQTIRKNGTGLMLHTTLLHSSGQSQNSEYPLPSSDEPQKFGSALTYARRYSLSSMCGVAADEDDDAEAVANRKITPEQVELLQIEIDGREVDVSKFLFYMSKLAKQEIPMIEDIPASQFESALAALRQKAVKAPKKGK
jgi:hypothetical protein